MALTPKQQLFVQEYLVDLNSTQAAIRAGYSEKTAHVIGHENINKPNIADAINDAMQKRAQKVSVTAEDVLQSILDIRTKTMEAERYNEALRANELLGKHLKLFTDKTEVTGADGGPIAITRVELVALDSAD